MNFFRCRRCLYPSTKPDIYYDERGICSACLAYDKRETVDWNRRHAHFIDLLNRHRGVDYDCIVAVSGGKDSHAQVLKVLELGYRPLAVCAATDHLTPLGRRNLDNIATLCDLVEVTPNKTIRAHISRFALHEVGDISWCEHHVIWSIPIREAVKRNIPLVIYGECPQNEYGAGPSGSETQTRMTQSWMHEFGGLLGLRLEDVRDILGIDDRNLEIYRYPENAEGVQAVFLGAYYPWDGYENYLLALRNGFAPHHRMVEGSIYEFENLDNAQTGIHDFLRYRKFGYGRAVDIASNHIRRGRITRDAAIRLIAGRDGAYPATYLGIQLKHILERIGVTVTEFDRICERFTNREVVEWASRPESFQCFYQTATVDASRDASSMQAAE